jgi:hypothetical protein
MVYVFFLVFPPLLSFLPIVYVFFLVFPHLLPFHQFTSSASSFRPFCLSFIHLYLMALCTQYVTSPVSLPPLLLYVWYSSAISLCALLSFSHDRSNWSPFVCRTTLRKFPVIRDLFSELSHLLHQTAVLKCSVALVACCWNFRSSLLWQTVFLLFNVAFNIDNLNPCSSPFTGRGGGRFSQLKCRFRWCGMAGTK